MSKDEFQVWDMARVRDPVSRRWNVEAKIIKESISDNLKPVSIVLEFKNGNTSIRHK